MTCCSIIPNDVLKRLASDPSLPSSVREGLQSAIAIDKQIRVLREQARKLTTMTASIPPALAALAAPPVVTVYDCRHGTALPGVPVNNPGNATDPTAKRTFTETQAVSKFYQTVFGRNSIDGAGMSMQSSIHYDLHFNNAFWNGTQMTYGDGDGQIFVDFTASNDVICHELTHGVTQHSLMLVYTNEAGGLNESLSDVFGSMFRQWQAGQTVTSADWLIGSDIMGPAARARGYTCLRDMAKPGDPHCLAPQPFHYSRYRPGMDPHTSSGIPNFAFYTAAMAIGGKSWDVLGKVWYDAIISLGAKPNLRMAAFAAATRASATRLYPAKPAIFAGVDAGWKAVGL